jgi:hypothetical protein
VAGLLDELADLVVPLLGELDDLVEVPLAPPLVLLRRKGIAIRLGLVHLRILLHGQVDNARLEAERLEETALLQHELASGNGGSHLRRTGGGVNGSRGGSLGTALSGGSSLLGLPVLPVGASATALGLERTVGLEVVGGVLESVSVSVTVSAKTFAVTVAVTAMTVTVTVSVAALTRLGSASHGGGGCQLSLGSGGVNGGSAGVLARGELLEVGVVEIALDQVGVVEVTLDEVGVLVTEVAFSELDVSVRGGEGGNRNGGGEGSEESKGGFGVHVDYIYVEDLSDGKSIGKRDRP